MMRHTALLILVWASAAPAQAPFHAVAAEVNPKLVKLFGSGGYQRITAYGTGVLVSADGHVLTTNTPMLDTPDLRVHLWDGRKYQAKVVVIEPELDAALLKITDNEKAPLGELPHFDLKEAAGQPLRQAGDWVLAFSNQFEIATRDEPMTVQRGVVAAVAKFQGRLGVFEAPYRGQVYVVDAITNNPGAGGGALTTVRGELIGLVGKELRNSQTDTWVNYAVPLAAKVEVRTGDQTTQVGLADFVEQGVQGKYKPAPREARRDGEGGYSGIVLVPNVVDRTPPYIEEVVPDSPAGRAGLRPDDLIVYVDSEPVVSVTAFRSLMDRVRPGTPVKVEVRRGEKLVAVEFKLDELPRRGAKR